MRTCDRILDNSHFKLKKMISARHELANFSGNEKQVKKKKDIEGKGRKLERIQTKLKIKKKYAENQEFK